MRQATLLLFGALLIYLAATGKLERAYLAIKS